MSTINIKRREVQIGLLICVLVVLGVAFSRFYLRSPDRGLPYHDLFTEGRADEWKALGGTWELSHGAMRNDSDERGAKLLTGSPAWRNYSIEADIDLLGVSGDAGLIIRSSDEEEGVNSYSGYYAGMRTRDNSLVLGRAEHGWIEMVKELPRPNTIRPFKWYHLKLMAYGCDIVATLTVPLPETPYSLGIHDPECVRSGRIGLRSYSSGGIWRNIAVRPATQKDLLAMTDGSRPLSNSATSDVGGIDPAVSETRALSEQPREAERVNSGVRSIESLRLDSYGKTLKATIRGVVILATPMLFVQDSTGGIYISRPAAPLLKVGDEVEATGEVHSSDFSTKMEHATVQLLWARAPMPPVSVTASQASTGKFDATFIELQGRLTGKERGPDNTIILEMDEGSQSFRAILNPGRSDYLFGKLKPGSSVLLRGICVVDPAFTKYLTPFVLLLRSNEDLEVLAGPPWWSTEHVVAIVLATLLLALVALYLYHRVEHWRLRAILEERGRMAHEMHDTLAQSFAGIGFQLQAIRNSLAGETSPLHQQLELASTLVRHSHEEARRSIATLRNEALESEDVLAALERSARRMVEGGSVKVVTVRMGDERPMPLRIVDTLQRIGQEAIANAVRHANPSVLTIRLDCSENLASLQIEDNGNGFTQGSGLLGFGIRGMRRRAQSISAALQIESTPGEGTRVGVAAPLPPRVTLTSWPRLLWKYAKERWVHARSSTNADSYSYRG